MSRRDDKRCPRCNGAMVYERFLDMLDMFYAWRCLNCGEIMDSVVARNRGRRGNRRRSGRLVDPQTDGQETRQRPGTLH